MRKETVFHTVGLQVATRMTEILLLIVVNGERREGGTLPSSSNIPENRPGRPNAGISLAKNEEIHGNRPETSGVFPDDKQFHDRPNRSDGISLRRIFFVMLCGDHASIPKTVAKGAP